MVGIATGMSFIPSSDPQTPVWPGASTAAIRAARPRRPPSDGAGPVATSTPRCAVALLPLAFDVDPSVVTALIVRSWSVVPAALARFVAGASMARNGRSKAISRPASSRTVSTTNAPGPVSSGARRSVRKRPMRPPVQRLTSMSWSMPTKPTYARPMPRSVRPHGAPFSLPGPHSRYQPATSSTNGSSQRPEPTNGAAVSRHQSVRLPLPGSVRAIRVTAPRPSRNSPTSDRTTSEDRPSDSRGSGRPRREDVERDRDDGARVGRRAGVERGVERRCFAIR